MSLAGIALWLALATTAAPAPPPTLPPISPLPYAGASWDERLPVVHALYSALSTEILGLTAPVSVTAAGRDETGTGRFVELSDARGKTLVACLDIRPRAPNIPLDPALVHFGVRRPEAPGDQASLRLGPEEAALYGVLLRWAAARPTYEELLRIPEEARTAEQQRDLVVALVLRELDMRFMPVPRM